MSIDDQIKIEYDSLLQAIMPSERIQHANRLAELEREKELQENLTNPDE